MAIEQATLRGEAANYSRFSSVIIKNAKEKEAGQRKSAFLCHSHRDEELVKGLIVIFQKAGVDLYVDWQDHTMPEKPNKVTAQKIQHKIMTSDVFMFLATANSKASRWCPWEIGYADNGKKSIYIIPTSDNQNSYGNEYLDLYPKIDTAYVDGAARGCAVFQPGASQGKFLSNATLR